MFPNITGYTTIDNVMVLDNSDITGGAFSVGDKVNGTTKGSKTSDGMYRINFNASNSSSKYGSSSTIQPDSKRCYVLVKF